MRCVMGSRILMILYPAESAGLSGFLDQERRRPRIWQELAHGAPSPRRYEISRNEGKRMLTWPTNLDKHLLLDGLGVRHVPDHQRRLAIVPRRSPREVCLVLLALGVREVRALVDVQGEAQTALESAQMCSGQSAWVLSESDARLAWRWT